MLFDHFPNLTNEEAENIAIKYPILKRLWLEFECRTKENDAMNDAIFNHFYKREFDAWLMQFNNRLGAIKVTYLLIRHYYDMKFPVDDCVNIPGQETQSLEFCRNTTDQYYDIKWFFNYFTEMAFYRIFSVWDSVLHLINIYYHFDVKPGPHFEKMIHSKLESKNKALIQYLKGITENDTYIKAKILRNNIAHNFTPSLFSHWIEREKTEKARIIRFSYKDTAPKKFMDNIDGLLVLLADSLQDIKEYLIKTEPF